MFSVRYEIGYYNCRLDTEFPASVTKKAAGGSRGSCLGKMHVSVTMSPEISSLSRIKDRHLLSLDDHSRFSCGFSLVHLILSRYNSHTNSLCRCRPWSVNKQKALIN